MKKLSQTCRNCRYLSVPLDAAGRRVPRKGNVYSCSKVTNLQEVKFPKAVTIKITRRYMRPMDGADCPAWESYDEMVRKL